MILYHPRTVMHELTIIEFLSLIVITNVTVRPARGQDSILETLYNTKYPAQ